MALEPSAFDPLRTTALDLSTALANGTLTSQSIVLRYLAQIEAHNHAGLHLNAIASVAPSSVLLATAKRLDEERAQGIVRGPFHGVPIVFKDAFITHPSLGMSTTCGAAAFAEARAKRSSPVVQRLVDRGFIPLAKTTLSEFCGHKTWPEPVEPGWSSLYGHAQSPYIEGGLRKGEYLAGHSSAGGSSTGSAVAVAAGFAPLALATETSGSLVLPANRAGLYGLKIGGGAAGEGVFKISKSFDCVGVMGKCAWEVAGAVEAMVEGGKEEWGREGLIKGVERGWEGLRVGFVDPKVWRVLDWPSREREECDTQIEEEFMQAKEKIEGLVEKVVYPVQPITASQLKIGNEGLNGYIAMREFSDNMKDFAAEFDDCPVKTLEELSVWNIEHADIAMPKPHDSQGAVLHSMKLVEDPVKASREIEEAKMVLKTIGPNLHDTLTECGIDVIVAPSDSMLCGLAAVFGHPVGVVPLGYLPIGQPQGLTIVSDKNREDVIIHFMAAFEKTFEGRRAPALLEK